MLLTLQLNVPIDCVIKSAPEGALKDELRNLYIDV